MPRAATRKKIPATPPKSRRRLSAVKTSCSACGGVKGAHTSMCPNYACPKCEMRAGNHKMDCPYHARVERGTEHRGEPVLDGTTGAVLTVDVDGEPAKIDTTPRAAELGVKVDTETLLMELAQKQQIVNARKSERGRASNALKQAIEDRDAVIGMLAQRGLDLREPTLPGVGSAADFEVDTSDESDDDDEDDE